VGTYSRGLLFGGPAASLSKGRSVGFASPPCGGFAFVVDGSYMERNAPSLLPNTRDRHQKAKVAPGRRERRGQRGGQGTKTGKVGALPRRYGTPPHRPARSPDGISFAPRAKGRGFIWEVPARASALLDGTTDYPRSGGSGRTLPAPRRTRRCSRRTPSPRGMRKGAPGRSSVPPRCRRGPLWVGALDFSVAMRCLLVVRVPGVLQHLRGHSFIRRSYCSCFGFRFQPILFRYDHHLW
jgi:hypothetical protein